MFTKKALSVGISTVMMALPISEVSAEDSDVEEVFVTGVAQPTTKLESTNSITSLSTEEITNFAPRSTAEIFRNLPGIQAESSSGDSNANIKVRGIPISQGGSRYLSIQEDGHPALLIGDFDFATSDSFIRFDRTIGSVQSIRGGSAATQAANSAGGIVNFISQTGEVQGGSYALTTGLDYDSNRLDFSYGSPLDNGWSFHFGGFARKGEGPREQVDDDAESGLQLKLNVAKEFSNGFAKLSFKHLDDRTPTYLPIYARYNGGSSYSEVGTSFSDGTLYQNGANSVNRRSGRVQNDLSTGFEAQFSSIGLQTEWDLSDVTTLGFNHRTAIVNGRFAAPFADNSATFDASTGDGTFVQFDTELDSLNNYFTNAFVNHEFGLLTAKAAVAYNIQDYDTQWSFNTFTFNVNKTNSAEQQVGATFAAQSTPNDGCCQRDYDLQIENIAPSLSLMGDIGARFSWDASVRHDFYTVDGSVAIGGDGFDSTGAERFSPSRSVDYDTDFTSASLGGNFSLTDDSAIFANIARGASLIAPSRVITNDNITASGDLLSDDLAYAKVFSVEGGYKYDGNQLRGGVTLFYTETEEPGTFEVTTNSVFSNSYESLGVELEGAYDYGYGFSVAGSFTLTDAEITDSSNTANIGNQPRRQADWIFNITPQYSGYGHTVGMNFYGTDEVYTQDNNGLTFDSYVVGNLFWNYSPSIIEGLNVGLNVNNIWDQEGFTEGEEGTASAGDIVRIRPINGRTTALVLRYDF